MTIGSTARRLMGPRVEALAVDRYRRLFVDLDALAATIAGLGPFSSVIEVGCGEGELMTRLMNTLGPDTSALGIDIAPNSGHGYSGPQEQVTFRHVAVADVVAEGQRFELVVVSDVLHHIPPPDRRGFLESCRSLLAPNGTIVVKEWVRRKNLAHLAAYVSDRYVSGDKGVEFYTADELRAIFSAVYCTDGRPPFASHARPHWNNVVLASRRPAPDDQPVATLDEALERIDTHVEGHVSGGDAVRALGEERDRR